MASRYVKGSFSQKVKKIIDELKKHRQVEARTLREDIELFIRLHEQNLLKMALHPVDIFTNVIPKDIQNKMDSGDWTFKELGLETAEEAVNYSISHGIPRVDLREYGDTVTDELVDTLTKNHPNIHQIFIESGKISSAAVQSISERCPSLKTLDLSYCTSLTSLPDDLSPLASLKTLYLHGWSLYSLPEKREGVRTIL